MSESTATAKILKQEPALRYTLAVVYEPNTPDAEGDFATESTIRQAAWDFLAQLQHEARALSDLLAAFKDAHKHGSMELEVVTIDDDDEAIHPGVVIGDMHREWRASMGELVESYLAPVDLQIGDETVRAGTWLVGIRWGPELWERIQRGERIGVSLGGWARERAAT